MSASDGYVIGLTKRLDHGPAGMRFNIVLVAEGFQASEMPKFHNEVNKFIDKLFNTKPFDEMWCAVNVYSLDVASTESGADEPSGGECTGSGITRATYFDATFCSGGIQRALSVDAFLVYNTVNSYFSDHDVIIVIVNSMTYGGLGSLFGGVCTYSLGFSPITGKGGVEIAIYEMGHSAFQLADEYAYGQGNNYTGSEPFKPNITANTDKNTIKWKDLIASSTAVPTQSNPNCAQEDTSPSPVATGTVGGFRGRRLLPLRTLSSGVQLPNARAGQSILRRLPAANQTDAAAVHGASDGDARHADRRLQGRTGRDRRRGRHYLPRGALRSRLVLAAHASGKHADGRLRSSARQCERRDARGLFSRRDMGLLYVGHRGVNGLRADDGALG